MDKIFNKLYKMQSLGKEESKKLFNYIIQGKLDPTLLASALTALKLKKETPEEIAGAVEALLENAEKFPRPEYDFADNVGTGGDGFHTINISTASAFVAAACGVKIVKHGNRGVSSRSGSSDLLSTFGVHLAISAKAARQALDELGICFLFAPQYHSGIRHAALVRQRMKTRTFFNILGPLVNPARPPLEVMGIYSLELLTPVAETMRTLGLKHAFIVHGAGLDEVALHGKTKIAELYKNKIEYYTLTPKDFGLPVYPIEKIKGGSPEENHHIITSILQGKGEKAQQAIIAANTALLLRLFGYNNLKENTEKAQDIMASGQPYRLLKALAKRR